MFFYVDEGGNTGLNLFDPNQPTLYYGVLSSEMDLDVAALAKVAKMRRRLGVERLHAKDLANAKLPQIASQVLSLMRKLRLRFDFYKVVKADHAVTCFFDQVFDSAMNEAVRWGNYWTPMRYALLLSLAELFDEELAKAAWLARIEGDGARAASQLKSVCEQLLSRVGGLEDEQARERIGDALTWAKNNPAAISYNVSTADLGKKERKGPAHQVSPNIVGFQSVMAGIARRLKAGDAEASRIVVDQQAEFNTAQEVLAKFYADAAGIDLVNGPGLPKLTFDSMPSTPIEFMSSQDSAGLELVDVILWVHRRLDEDKPLARELLPIYLFNAPKGMSDELSLEGIARRWGPELSAPVDLSDVPPEQLAWARERAAMETARVKAALSQSEG